MVSTFSVYAVKPPFFKRSTRSRADFSLAGAAACTANFPPFDAGAAVAGGSGDLRQASAFAGFASSVFAWDFAASFGSAGDWVAGTAAFASVLVSVDVAFGSALAVARDRREVGRRCASVGGGYRGQ